MFYLNNLESSFIIQLNGRSTERNDVMRACDVNCNCTIFHQDVLEKVENTLKSDQVFSGLIDVFKVFSDLTRLKILEAIKDDALCVCDLAYLLNVSKSAISHQMKTLKSFDLVSSEKKGKMVYYHLKREAASKFIETANTLRRGLMT